MIIIKNNSTVPLCDLVSKPSGISAVTVIVVFPNPMTKSEVAVAHPRAGILGILPLLSPPISIIPLRVIFHVMFVASVEPMFLINAFIGSGLTLSHSAEMRIPW